MADIAKLNIKQILNPLPHLILNLTLRKDKNMSLLTEQMNQIATAQDSVERGVFCFTGGMQCLIEMWRGLKDEGCYFDKGVIKGARGQIEPRCPKYSPYRICEEKKS